MFWIWGMLGRPAITTRTAASCVVCLLLWQRHVVSETGGMQVPHLLTQKNAVDAHLAEVQGVGFAMPTSTSAQQY